MVLFLGAGFSLGAKNRIGENFPTGWKLGQKLWEFLGYQGEYHDTPLSILYQDFVDVGIKRSEKIEFLNNNLLSGEIPDIYNNISLPFWHKIYTINIDDVIQKSILKVIRN